MTAQTTYGLECPQAIRWLLSAESKVYVAVQEFIEGKHGDFVDVAGPPTLTDLLHFYEKKAQTVPLPCVRLRLAMTKHHLTGEQGVRVVCSDKDLTEIERWQQMARLQKTGATLGRA